MYFFLSIACRSVDAEPERAAQHRVWSAADRERNAVAGAGARGANDPASGDHDLVEFELPAAVECGTGRGSTAELAVDRAPLDPVDNQPGCGRHQRF